MVAARSNVTDSDASHYTSAQPAVSIDIERDTNGSDGDAAPGPTVTAGTAITWTYLVTNDGCADLTSVTVTDNDNSLAVNCSPPANPIGIPDPFTSGSSFTCTATGTATPVVWTYVVTNTGDVPLVEVAVSDDREGPVDCDGQTSLAVGESMTCTVNGAVVSAGLYMNVGEATATSADGRLAFNSDPSRYLGQAAGAGAAIDLVKLTNGLDTGASGPGPLTVGSDVLSGATS